MTDIKEAMQPEIPMRDWFAGLAMQGLISNAGGFSEKNMVTNMAAIAYKYADVMMKERDKNVDAK
jgi:hypothetical protein